MPVWVGSTGAAASSATPMCSWSTVVCFDCATRRITAGSAVPLGAGHQRGARVAGGVVAEAGVVEEQLREVEDVLVGGDALVLHVRAAVGRAVVALLDVERDVEQQQVEHHRRAPAEHRVVHPLDDGDERVERLLVVDVGVPLGEAVLRLLGEPLVDEAVGTVAVPGAGVAVAREHVVRERLAGEVLVGVVQQPVVLRPVVALVDDAGGLRVGVPVLEALEVRLGRGAHVGRAAGRGTRTRGSSGT